MRPWKFALARAWIFLGINLRVWVFRLLLLYHPRQGVRHGWIKLQLVNYTTKEEITLLEHFLEERVPNFHRVEAEDGLSDENRKKRNVKWAYVILLLSALSSVFMAWYVLSHR